MAKHETMIWSKDRRSSVKASKIRSFAIYHGTCRGDTRGPWTDDSPHYIVAWIGKEEDFYIGSWPTLEETQMALTEIHGMIEGKD